MKCESCNHEIQQDMKFCGNCGAKPPEKSESPAPASTTTHSASAPHQKPAPNIVSVIKSIPPKKLVLFAAPVFALVLILVIVLAVSLLGGSNFDTSNQSISIFTDGIDTILSVNNQDRIVIDGNTHTMQVSMDGTRAALITDYDFRNGGTLWFVQGTNVTRVAEDVHEFVLSDTGRGLAFFSDRVDGTYTLYTVDTSSPSRATRVTDYALDVVISPDGRTILYSVLSGRDRDIIAAYMSVNGRSSSQFGIDLMPGAVSNGGRIVYYIDNSNANRSSFHVRRGNNSIRLLPDIPWDFTVFLNNDYSEALFTAEGRSHISRNGGERTTVSRTAITGIVTPNNAQVRAVFPGELYIYGLNSFANTVAITGDGLEYINSRFDTHSINGSTSHDHRARISDNGRALFFENRQGHLARVNPSQENADAAVLVRNINNFAISGDGSIAFAVNDGSELMYARGNRDAARIADFISPIHIVTSPNSNRVFFIEDFRNGSGDLYMSNNGRSRERIASDVTNVWRTNSNIFYLNVDGDLYRSNGNDNFTRFDQDIVRQHVGRW